MCACCLLEPPLVYCSERIARAQQDRYVCHTRNAPFDPTLGLFHRGASFFHLALRELRPASLDRIDWTNSYAARFRDAMNDDFDTPIAFAVLHELRGEVNRGKSAQLAGLLKALGGTIGFFQADPEAFLQGASSGLDVESLIAERESARAARDFPRSDAIRKTLEDAGIVLEDKPGGKTEWRRR